MALVKKVRKLGARGGFAAADRGASALRPRQLQKTAPCVAACPNGTDVRLLLTSIAAAARPPAIGHDALDEAFFLVADRNPLPAVSAWVCPHHCESRCHRAGHDGALSINQVERYLAERALHRALPLRHLAVAGPVERIAVVGAGPVGWSLAYQLARRGHDVTLFDPGETAGDGLRTGLPSGQVPTRLVDDEVGRLVAFGLEFRCDPGVTDPGWTPVDSERFARTVRTRLPARGHAIDPGGVVPANCYGRRQAELVDAEVTGRPVQRRTPAPSVGRDRVKFDHYEPRPRMRNATADAATVAGAAAGVSPRLADEILAEAERCLSCGACWECDNCYKYCPEQAVTKPLQAGQPYRFRLDFCNGCGKCADLCPCGYVDMV